MMSKILDLAPGKVMTHQEKRAWIMLVVSVAAYATYAALILSRADGQPLPRVPYAATLLWTVGASIANVIYLCFTLSAILGSVTKIIAYRKSFPQW
jgi:hypothetical protein